MSDLWYSLSPLLQDLLTLALLLLPMPQLHFRAIYG